MAAPPTACAYFHASAGLGAMATMRDVASSIQKLWLLMAKPATAAEAPNMARSTARETG